MKVRSFLLSALLVVSSNVVAEERFKDTVINTTTAFVERTVNMLVTPFLSDRDIECLARNIFFESRGEPVEGKVAVGLVTLNRTNDPNYPSDVCGVVKQRTVITVPQQVKEVKLVKTNLLLPPKEVVEVRQVHVKKTVCQFSWTCQGSRKIKHDDPAWIESQEIAQALARGEYTEYHSKYQNAKYFHAVYVKPGWKNKRIGKVGNHVFYE